MESWINHNIIIDFEVPKDIQRLFESCETAEKEQNWGYFSLWDALDCSCKELVTIGKMTKKQWNIIIERYGSYD
jgi:hypothetical protein